MMSSCQRESVDPLSSPPNNFVSGYWRSYSGSLATGDTTTFVSNGGNSYTVYQYDYIIHDPVNAVYDTNSRTITVSGNSGQYYLHGSGYYINSDTLIMTYTIDNSPWQNTTTKYYKLH